MDFKFSKDAGDSHDQEAPGEKKKQGALLVLLLILVGGFTYIYFFTSLIKPQEGQKADTPAPAAPAAQAVKMPLPAREGEPAKTPAPEKAEPPKAVAVAPATEAVPAAKPAAAPVKPAPAPAAKPAAPAPAPKPAPAPAKPKVEPKKVEAAKTAEKKPQAAPATEKKAAADAKKPAVADKKSPPAKGSDKKASVVDKSKPETATKSKKGVTGSWSLIVGNYVLEEDLAADMGHVRKAGFEPVVKKSVRKKSAMNRLLVSSFGDRASAQAALEKLKRQTVDAFVIEQGGSFNVYAGSYMHGEAASSEQDRLKAAGISTTIKKTDIAIPSQSLTVGPFTSKNAAVAALGKLKSVGLKAALSQK